MDHHTVISYRVQMEKSELEKMCLLNTSDPDFGLFLDTHTHYLESSILVDCKQDPELQHLLNGEFEQLKVDHAELHKIMANREEGSEANICSYAPG
mmetsp:Transcript_34597/g.34788  ORF Transcript_34597/g.34788 Transcript_34597/m.34788 type:complete len:96 (-) Transcript_34597:430-717(-)